MCIPCVWHHLYLEAPFQLSYIQYNSMHTDAQQKKSREEMLLPSPAHFHLVWHLPPLTKSEKVFHVICIAHHFATLSDIEWLIL